MLTGDQTPPKTQGAAPELETQTSEYTVLLHDLQAASQPEEKGSLQNKTNISLPQRPPPFLSSLQSLLSASTDMTDNDQVLERNLDLYLGFGG